METTDRFAVFQDLTVDRVTVRQREIRVEVSNVEGTKGTVTYSFGGRRERQSSLATLQAWRKERTPLTYVRAGSGGVLVDDRELLRRAFSAGCDRHETPAGEIG